MNISTEFMCVGSCLDEQQPACSYALALLACPVCKGSWDAMNGVFEHSTVEEMFVPEKPQCVAPRLGF